MLLTRGQQKGHKQDLLLHLLSPSVSHLLPLLSLSLLLETTSAPQWLVTVEDGKERERPPVEFAVDHVGFNGLNSSVRNLRYLCFYVLNTDVEDFVLPYTRPSKSRTDTLYK